MSAGLSVSYDNTGPSTSIAAAVVVSLISAGKSNNIHDGECVPTLSVLWTAVGGRLSRSKVFFRRARSLKRDRSTASVLCTAYKQSCTYVRGSPVCRDTLKGRNTQHRRCARAQV